MKVHLKFVILKRLALVVHALGAYRKEPLYVAMVLLQAVVVSTPILDYVLIVIAERTRLDVTQVEVDVFAQSLVIASVLLSVFSEHNGVERFTS